MNQLDKLLHFEYVLKGLLDWYGETKDVTRNDISRLKALKLLFFVTAIKANRNQQHSLLDVFDDYYAMPYGHVESSIYSSLNEYNGDLKYFVIDNNRTTLKENVDISDLEFSLNPIYKVEIDDSIRLLKQKNPRLILLPPFQLVEISHTWYSWKHYFTIAKSNYSRSEKIPVEIIQTEDKVFA